MKPVTMGLIGAGFHARTVHIPAYDLMPELRLAALATSREETADSAGERYRVKGFGDYREMLKCADVEAVAVCTPGGVFAEICRAALEAGKHVLLETPGITDAASARELEALAKAHGSGGKGLVVQVGFLNRYSPPYEMIRERMAANAGPRLVCFEYYPFLWHTYNLALYLCGGFERVLSAARDSAGSAATIRFHNGDTAVVIGRSLANCSMNIESLRVSGKDFYASVEGRRRVRIIEGMKPTGVEGWTLPASEDVGYDPHVFASRYLVQSGTVAMLRGFVRAIREGVEPRSTLEDSVATGDLIAAVEALMTE